MLVGVEYNESVDDVLLHVADVPHGAAQSAERRGAAGCVGAHRRRRRGRQLGAEGRAGGRRRRRERSPRGGPGCQANAGTFYDRRCTYSLFLLILSRGRLQRRYSLL